MQVLTRLALSVLFLLAGVAHFRTPGPFLKIMPPALPYPLFLVYLSGLFEILGGLGIMIEKTRFVAGWGLVALLIAVFPANIYMAVEGVGFAGLEPDPVALWLRLPLQFVFMAVTWWVSRPEPDERKSAEA